MAKNFDLPPNAKPLWKHFNKLYYRYEVTTVFDDLLSASLNYFTLPGVENFPVSTFKKYKEEERKLFGLMFKELILMYHREMQVKEWADPLGDFYMFLASTSKQSGLGQFFTPEHVVEMMNRMVYSEDLKGQGLRVSDPACGSGRFLCAFHAMAPGNYCYGEDIDLICCKMACLNMVMHGCEGEVIWHDSLAPDDFRGGWKINPMIHQLGLPNILPAAKEDLYFFQSHNRQASGPAPEPEPEVIHHQDKIETARPVREKKPPEPEKKIQVGGQMQLPFF